MPCSQDDCPADALWQPVLELRPKHGLESQTLETSPLTFQHLGYCEEHRAKATVDTFLSDEGLVKIAKFMRENGKEPPDRDKITLTWKHVGEEELEILAEHQDRTESDQDLAF